MIRTQEYLAASRGPFSSEVDSPEPEAGHEFKDRGDGSKQQQHRGNWSGNLDFMFSCLSYAVGIGNVWRFPYLCYKNGGGAFLIPFFIMLVLAGMPLFYLELILGQYAGRGLVGSWKFSPLFTGLGYAMFLVSAFVSLYYNVLIAWVFYYLFASFAADVPWRHCNNAWNTAFCSDTESFRNCTSVNGTWFNKTCWSADHYLFENYTSTASSDGRQSASYEYFHYKVLEISSNITELGEVKWEIALCLLLAWTVVGLCLFKGIHSTGKAVYFTALFPYVVLIILLVRAVMLNGALEGIVYYIKPDFSLLAKAGVWGDAAVQIFFSLSPGWGGMITLASYNKFTNNVQRDAIFVSLANVATSIFAGFVIFSIIGFMAAELNMPIKDVVGKGAGLAFVAYPEVVARLPISPLWSVLFFLMLLTLGLGTQFTTVTTVHSFLLDLYPKYLRVGWRSSALVAVICTVSFLLGLPMCTQGGMYVLQMMDSYAASYNTLMIGLIECLVIAWVYGIPKFSENIEAMLGSKPSIWWTICWRFISPAVIAFILIFTFIEFNPLTYNKVKMPWWTDMLGWMMSFVCILPVPIYAVYLIKKHRKGTVLETVKLLSKPTKDWGPATKLLRQHHGHPVAAPEDLDEREILNVVLTES